jgi:hypothetical protein
MKAHHPLRHSRRIMSLRPATLTLHVGRNRLGIGRAVVAALSLSTFSSFLRRSRPLPGLYPPTHHPPCWFALQIAQGQAGRRADRYSTNYSFHRERLACMAGRSGALHAALVNGASRSSVSGTVKPHWKMTSSSLTHVREREREIDCREWSA